MKTIKSKKTNLLYALCIAVTSITHAQNYTWMKGSTSSDQPGLYGTLGVPASTNNPGSRNGASRWTDASGDFWLFGGSGYDAAGNYDMLNDLWKYSVSTNQWTWIKGDSVIAQDGIYGTLGVAASSNNPGSRTGAITWTDANGNLWLFGGIAFDAFSNLGEINDLWKYDIASNQWTWMKGSNATGQLATFGTIGVGATPNTPGASYYGVSWVDASGNFWLFGGEGYDASLFGELQDLWKYNTTTNQWTWMKGSGNIGTNGAYGTILVPSATNYPGGRAAASGWADASGNLWLFGGYGFDASSSSADFLNDLWKYSIANDEWTWVNGSSAASQGGSYGTIGVSAPTNVPGARVASVSWRNASTGDLYLFGGFGNYTSLNIDDMNDLWRYSPNSNEWTWIKGDDQSAQPGTYGTQGVSSPANTPGSRSFSNSWVDNSNNLWLFGGSGYDDSFSYGDLNDLWKFTDCVAPIVNITSSQSTICPATSVNLTVSGADTYLWNTTQTLTTISVTPTITTTYSVVGTDINTGCSGNAFYTLEVYPIITASISSSNSGAIICKGETRTLTASSSNSYNWFNGATTPSIVVTYSALGAIQLACLTKDVNGCFYSAMINQTVVACNGINDNNTTSLKASSLYPNPNNGVFSITTPLYEGAQLVIFNSIGQKVIEQNLVSEKTEIQSTLQKGVYIYQLIQNNKKISNGKLIIE